MFSTIHSSKTSSKNLPEENKISTLKHTTYRKTGIQNTLVTQIDGSKLQRTITILNP
jgi:hypothetical protein